MIKKIQNPELPTSHKIAEKLMQLSFRHHISENLNRTLTGTSEWKKQKNKVLQLIKELKSSQFVIDTQAHEISCELSNILQKEFPTLKPQLVLLGSHASGGATLRNAFLASNTKSTDFDYAVLIPDLDDPKILEQVTPQFLEQKKEISKLMVFIIKYLNERGQILCKFTNPDIKYAPALKSVDDAKKMLIRCFLKNNYRYGSLYFSPTYPIEYWEQNMRMISLALKKIKKYSKYDYEQIFANIQKMFENEVTFKLSHIFDETIATITHEERALATESAKLLSQFIGKKRAAKLSQLSKPNYLVK